MTRLGHNDQDRDLGLSYILVRFAEVIYVHCLSDVTAR